MLLPSVRKYVLLAIATMCGVLNFHIGQCRPLSKTVRFNVLRVAKNKAAAKTFGKF